MARPGLEPGTPRFSAACPPQVNVTDLQRNRKRVAGRRIREDSRTLGAIAVVSGTRSRTCAQIASETRLGAPRRPPVARPGRDDLQGRAASQGPALVTAESRVDVARA